MSIKEQIHRLVDTLPDESHAALEEMQYRLYVLDKIEQGIRELDAGKVIADEELRAEFSKWLVD